MARRSASYRDCTQRLAMHFRLILIVGATAPALASCTSMREHALSSDLTMEKLIADVAYLKDRQQIHDAYLRYMRGFDRNDVDLMRSAFWPDVQINYGAQSNTFDEFVVRHLSQHTSTLSSWGHLLTNETVEIDGDLAHAEAYVTRLSSSAGNEKSMIISGRYIDRFERRKGEWRIAVREFIPFFLTETGTNLDGYIKQADWAPASPCGMGTWNKLDPSYRRPLDRRMNKDIGPACAESAALR